MEEEDRISQLPQHILQNHILSLLPQKDAVQTCVLSKSWRDLGPTRPKFEFHRFWFEGNEKFLSAVENTLQRYDDQKLSIQKFILGMTRPDCWSKDSISLLEKWIPIVIMKMGVKKFKLIGAYCFSLPSVVFQAKSLEKLYLTGCNLYHIENCIVNLQALKSLELHEVDIGEEGFEKIMSGCPLIEHLVLRFCTGLMRLTLAHKARNLKHVRFNSADAGARFEINDAPNLETIFIASLQWVDLRTLTTFALVSSLCLCMGALIFMPHTILNYTQTKEQQATFGNTNQASKFRKRIQAVCELSNNQIIRFGLNWRELR